MTTTPVRLAATLTRYPPSANKMYAPTKWGKRKTAATRNFEVWAIGELGKAWSFADKPDPTKPHELILFFYMPKVENKSWPDCKTRFVRRDVSNLIKVLEDVIAKASGLDDSATFDTHFFKRLDTQNPRIEIVLQELPESVLSDGG